MQGGTTTVPRRIYLPSIIGIAWRTSAIAGGCYRAIRAWHRYIYTRVSLSLSLLAFSPWASGTQAGELSYSALLCYVVTLPSGVMDLAHYRPEHRPAPHLRVILPSRTASMHRAPFLRLFPPRNARHISRVAMRLYPPLSGSGTLNSKLQVTRNVTGKCTDLNVSTVFVIVQTLLTESTLVERSLLEILSNVQAPHGS